MPTPDVVSQQPEIVLGRKPDGNWSALIRLPSPDGPVEFSARGFDNPQDAFAWAEDYITTEDPDA